MTRPRDRLPIAPQAAALARRSARRERIPIAQARANVARAIALRTYWTRARSYADLHKIGVNAARSRSGFLRNERIIRTARTDPDASPTAQRAVAEKLIRALKRQGLLIGKGKTWRDYVRRRRGGGELEPV